MGDVRDVRRRFAARDRRRIGHRIRAGAFSLPFSPRSLTSASHRTSC